MNDDRKQDMIDIITRLANTTDGMALLKYLRDDYLLKSPIDKDSVEMTYHKLGEQQLVKNGLKLINDHTRFDRVKIIPKFNQRGATR